MFQSIKSISDYYKQLELHDGGWVFSTNAIRALSQLESQTLDDSIKLTIKWERAVLGYLFKQGELVPSFSTTGKDGIIHSVPNMHMFSDGGLDYVVKRSSELKNQFLIAHYNHLLWHTEVKNRKYAECAIDAYFSLFEAYRNVNEIATQLKINLVENLFLLSIDASYQTKEVKGLIKQILFDKEFWIYGWQVSLLRFMLDQKAFKKADFEGTIDLIQEINGLIEKNGDYSSIHNNLEVALRISDKTQSNKNEITKQLGSVCEKIAEDKSDLTSKMVALMFLSEALYYYESINDEISAERVSVEITELKKVHELAMVSIPIDVSNLNSYNGFLKSKAQILLTQEQEGIYLFLSNDNPLLFPNIDKIRQSSNTKDFRLYDLFQRISFDINSNLSRSDDQQREKSIQNFVQSYSLCLNFSMASFLFPLFFEGIKSRKLNYPGLREYLFKHTWFGEQLVENRNGQKIEFTWLEIISPSLLEFFSQLDLMQYTGVGNFTLVVDSLTLKFEGIIRDFAELLGAKTLTAQKKHGKFSTREMYLEDILRNDKIQEYFDESDRAFFNYLFLNGGLNIRNNVAHCFFKPSDYDLRTSLLLVLAILRLSKYNLIERQVTVSED